MPVKIACPNPDCDASYSVADENLGRLGRCKKCGTKFPLIPPTRAEVPPRSNTDLDSFPTPRAPIEADLPSPFGRYEIVRELGRGGMGAVYLAHDSQLDRPVALKVPHREVAQNRDVRERFLREARAAARCHHPNFCPIHDIGEVDGLPYLTMAYIEGGTFASTIEQGKPWDQRRAAEVVRQLALALAEAHRQGVVHRDLKPANVMIDARGGLVIMDFGLARRFEADDPTLTAAGAVMGTPGYMPPEQAEGRHKEVGPRSDVYSLGVILYELISGRRPFEGSVVRVLAMILTAEPPAPSSLHPGVSSALEKVCLKAMAKEVPARYVSMDEFAGALQAWLDEPALDIGSKLPRSTVGWQAMPATRPMRTWIAAVAAFAALLIGIIIYVAADGGRIRADDPITDVRRGDGPAPNVVPGSASSKEPRPAQPPPPTVAVNIPKPSDPSPPPEPLTKTARPTSEADGRFITNSLGMKMMLIPEGVFPMGSDPSDSDASKGEAIGRDKHQVQITRPFYLGATEVTVGQFRQFVEKTTYKTDVEKDGKGGKGWDEGYRTFLQDPKYTWRSPGFPQTDVQPVVLVSWNDAVAFCDWLSKKERQTYRLPTEAEWEYACRAGQATRFWFGGNMEDLATAGNVADASAKGIYPSSTYSINAKDGYIFTAPVGSFRPNAFGLFDTHGNVWEWCADWYAEDYYSKSPAADPMNSSPPPSNGCRVIRGGSWCSDRRYCRSANRGWCPPGAREVDIGFRVARVL